MLKTLLTYLIAAADRSPCPPQDGVAAGMELSLADATASRQPGDLAAAQAAADAADVGDAAAQGEAADAAVGSAEDDDDKLEAPSIPSGDDSDGNEEVSSASWALPGLRWCRLSPFYR